MEIRKFLMGFMEEEASGRVFRFDEGEETRFIQDVNLYLKERCADIKHLLRMSPDDMLTTDELERRKHQILPLRRDLIVVLNRQSEVLTCLLKAAKMRPMLLVNLNMHLFSVMVLSWLMSQELLKLKGISDLIRVIELSPMKSDVITKFHNLAYLGSDNDEVCDWIFQNWRLCNMSRQEVHFFMKKEGVKQNLLYRILHPWAFLQ